MRAPNLFARTQHTVHKWSKKVDDVRTCRPQIETAMAAPAPSICIINWPRNRYIEKHEPLLHQPHRIEPNTASSVEQNENDNIYVHWFIEIQLKSAAGAAGAAFVYTYFNLLISFSHCAHGAIICDLADEISRSMDATELKFILNFPFKWFLQ